MAYNEELADRIREALVSVRKVKEKKMFRGITFMVDDKMCISVSADELMCRINPALTNELLERNGTRPMVREGRAMKGFIYVSEEGYKSKKDFDYWVKLCLEFNKEAKSSKKKK